MSITAKVENGTIKLPADVQWPSGTVVRVEPVEENKPTSDEEQIPTLAEMFKDFEGIVKDAPSDLAANVDHYVHGHPRK